MSVVIRIEQEGNLIIVENKPDVSSQEEMLALTEKINAAVEEMKAAEETFKVLEV